jgi:hypothetical protein
MLQIFQGFCARVKNGNLQVKILHSILQWESLASRGLLDTVVRKIIQVVNFIKARSLEQYFSQMYSNTGSTTCIYFISLASDG